MMIQRSLGPRVAKKVSIITVTKDNRQGLLRTLESISCQDHDSFELIVVDGGSTDGTAETMEAYKEIAFTLLKDGGAGIYPAMNLGLQYATGDWVVFMNAGDVFYDRQTVGSFPAESDADIVHGVAWKGDGPHELRYGPNLDIWKGMPFCHQSAFFRRSAFGERNFDDSFTIAADFEFLLWAASRKLGIERFPGNVAIIEPGGVSEVRIVKRVWECYRAAARYYPEAKVHWFYFIKLLWAVKRQAHLFLESYR